MIVALILILAIVGVGLVLYVEHKIYLRRHPKTQTEEEVIPTETEECCGMHITCEKDSLLSAVSTTIEYYDDEELDRFADKDPMEYTSDDIEEFRDIMLSMQPTDIAGWVRSLQLRRISIPQPVRDELIMIVSEARSAASHA